MGSTGLAPILSTAGRNVRPATSQQCNGLCIVGARMAQENTRYRQSPNPGLKRGQAIEGRASSINLASNVKQGTKAPARPYVGGPKRGVWAFPNVHVQMELAKIMAGHASR